MIGKDGYTKHEESDESIIRRKISQMRTLAAEAQARGDGFEAMRLDHIADITAQTFLFEEPKPEVIWHQMELFK